MAGAAQAPIAERNGQWRCRRHAIEPHKGAIAIPVPTPNPVIILPTMSMAYPLARHLKNDPTMNSTQATAMLRRRPMTSLSLPEARPPTPAIRFSMPTSTPICMSLRLKRSCTLIFTTAQMPMSAFSSVGLCGSRQGGLLAEMVTQREWARSDMALVASRSYRSRASTSSALSQGRRGCQTPGFHSSEADLAAAAQPPPTKPFPVPLRPLRSRGDSFAVQNLTAAPSLQLRQCSPQTRPAHGRRLRRRAWPWVARARLDLVAAVRPLAPSHPRRPAGVGCSVVAGPGLNTSSRGPERDPVAATRPTQDESDPVAACNVLVQVAAVAWWR